MTIPLFEIELNTLFNDENRPVFYGQCENWSEVLEVLSEWQGNIAGPFVEYEYVIRVKRID